jgi:chitinase
MKDEVDKVRAAGGDVKISFGGENGIELAQACTTSAEVAAEYQAVVTAYQATYVDFDIEGAAVAEPASIERRSAALKLLQSANPQLRISLTLPVLPTGLDANGLGVLRSARDHGVSLDRVNVMAMDYGGFGTAMGDLAVQAAQSTHDQLAALFPSLSDAALWRMVGVTPMLGVNDIEAEVFGLNDARTLVSFAQRKHLGMLAFWDLTRDRNACTGDLDLCTNVPQEPYEFSRVFAGFTG